MPVQVVATASPHCAHKRYPQASLALVRGAWEAAKGKEGSPSLPGQSTPWAGLAACCPRGSVCTRDKKCSLLEGCRWAGNASCTAGTGGTPLRTNPKHLTCTTHSCQKRQLLVIIDGKQQPERRRMHTPVGDVMAQSHPLFKKIGGGLPFFLSKTSSIPRAPPS